MIEELRQDVAGVASGTIVVAVRLGRPVVECEVAADNYIEAVRSVADPLLLGRHRIVDVTTASPL